jgi:hypothetical protein
MATNNRGGNRGRSGRNNNPEGRNQYSGVMSSARDNPIVAAAAVGGAVAAGMFLWSRRNQISDQIAGLADQVSEWRDGMQSDSNGTGDSFMAASDGSGSDRSQVEIAEEALTLKETGEPA